MATLELFNPCGIYAADLKPALESEWHDIEDYLIAHATEHMGAEYLITRDVEVAQRSPVRALFASGMLHVLECDYGLVFDEVSFDIHEHEHQKDWSGRRESNPR